MIDDILKQIEQNPENVDNYRVLANCYLDENNYKGAYLAYQEILKRNEGDIQSLLNSGSLMYYNQEYSKAVQFFEKGIEIEPENAFLHYNLGNVYAEMNDFRNAQKEYNLAVKNGMKDAQIYNALGILYSDNEKYADSKDCFIKALKLEPENPEYLSNYATLCQRMDDIESAKELFKKSFDIKEDARIALALANLYVQEGDKNQAEKFFKKTLDINPEYYSAWVCWAIFCSDENDFDNAIKYYKNAIELEPKKPNAYMLLANLLSGERRYNEAIDVYKKALELTDNKAMVCVFIANAFMLNSDMKNAIEYYRLAINQTDDNAEILLIYIDILNDYIEGKNSNAA